MENPIIRRISGISSRARRLIAKHPRVSIAGGIILVLVTSFFVYRQSMYVAAGNFLDVGRPLVKPVDDVLILGGDLQTRPFVAAEIYKAGFAKRILVVSVKRDTGSTISTVPNETAITAAILKFRGVPADEIHILDRRTVDSTRDEARELKSYLDKHPNRKVAVVTNNYHTRRARLTFNRIVSPAAGQIVFVSVPTDGFSPDDWFDYRQGWSTYLLEYVKLTYHWLTLPSS